MVFTYKIQIQEGKCSQFQYGDCRACTGPSMSVSLVPETVDQPSLCVQGTCTTWEAVLGVRPLQNRKAWGTLAPKAGALHCRLDQKERKGYLSLALP